MLGEKFFSIKMRFVVVCKESVTASDAKLASTAVCNTIERLRSDTEFSLFWDSAISRACELQLPEPRLPRTRRPQDNIMQALIQVFFFTKRILSEDLL